MILFYKICTIFLMCLTFYTNMVKLQPLTNKSPESITMVCSYNVYKLLSNKITY